MCAHCCTTLPGDVNQVLSLLDEGLEVDALGAQGRTALHRALGGGHHGLARTLIERGARVAVIDSMGRTSMHWAAMAPTALAQQCCLLLFELSEPEALATLGKQTKSGRAPLHSAAETGENDGAMNVTVSACARAEGDHL